MAMLFLLFILAIVVGIEGLSLVKKDHSIIDVTIDCGANVAANNPVLKILTDVDISAVAKCKNGEQSFTATDSVHYTLPAALTPSAGLCELNEKEGSDNFDIEVEVHYGEADSLILTKTKMVTVVCTYSGYGKDDSPEHTVGDGPQANIERQTIVGGTVPASDLTLSIQTVDDQDAVGPIAFDRRYSLFGSYIGAVPNVGLKPVSCEAFSDGGDRYSVLVAGCGDGFIFDRTDGFVTTGTTFRSPYFFAFHLADSGNLAFDCNVTLCSPSCEGTSCETVCGTVTAFNIANGQLSGCTGNNKYQDICTFACDAGYNQDGVGESTCGADGIWTRPQIICTPKDCGPEFPRGTLSTVIASSGTLFPNVADYTCNEGHRRLSGSAQIDCLPSGQWEDDALVCEPEDCFSPPAGDGSSGVAPGGTTLGKQATYSCDAGYTDVGGSGNAQIVCLPTGEWDMDNALSCVAKDCSDIPKVTAAIGKTPMGTTYPNVAIYECKENYQPIRGDPFVPCLDTGMWGVEDLLYCQCTAQLDVVLVIDGSYSVGSSNFGKMITQLADAMPRFLIEPEVVNVGAVVFDFTLEFTMLFKNTAAEAEAAIRAIRYPVNANGTTAGVGIARAHKMLMGEGRPGASKVMILLADGKSAPSPIPVADAAKADGIVIHSIGITADANMPELTAVASSPDKAKFADEWTVILTTLESVIDGVC